MAKVELRKPIATLLDEKAKLDQNTTTINDKYNRFSEELQRLRQEQFSYREAKEHLQNTNSNKPARQVFDQNIASTQRRIDEVLKELDIAEKERVVASSRAKAIDSSIKQLQNA